MEAIYHLGEIIRQRREALGLPQEKVCEGLCSTMTLSRFENSQQTPSRDCVIALLQRLGLPDDRYYARLTKDEQQLAFLKKELISYSYRFEIETGKNKCSVWKTSTEKLNKLELLIDKDDHITWQFILGTKVVLGTEERAYTLDERLELLLKAIRLTVPRFDLDEINSCLYSSQEMQIISQIAVSYSRGGKRRKAIDIYSQLLKYIQKLDPNNSQSSGSLSLVTYNYARELGLEKRYEESLEIAEMGRQDCIKWRHYLLLPGFLAIMAECYFFMENPEKSKELYRDAYYLYQAVGNVRDLAVIEREAKERLHLNF